MRFLQRMVNALGGAAGRGRGPRPGVLLGRRKEDTFRDYPADGLTPSRLVSILRAADSGDISAQMELFEQMEEKDAHLYSVANTRRLAVTGLPWEVVSAAEMPGWRAGPGGMRDKAAADEAAAHCNNVLYNLDGFEESLTHLSLAMGRNISLVEIVWEGTGAGLKLTRLEPVDFGRLVLGETDEIRVVTEESHDRDDLEAMLRQRITEIHQTLGETDVLISWTIAGTGPLLGRLRQGKLSGELLETLRAEYGYGPPAAWSVSLEAEPAAVLPLEWYEQQTIRGEFLRAVRHYQMNPDEPIDLESYLAEEHLAGSLGSTVAISSRATRDRVLLEAAMLGVDLLSPEESKS